MGRELGEFRAEVHAAFDRLDDKFGNVRDGQQMLRSGQEEIKQLIEQMHLADTARVKELEAQLEMQKQRASMAAAAVPADAARVKELEALLDAERQKTGHVALNVAALEGRVIRLRNSFWNREYLYAAAGEGPSKVHMAGIEPRGCV